MKVDGAKAIRLQHAGRTYYFCSEHCRERFLAEQAGEPAPAHAAH